MTVAIIIIGIVVGLIWASIKIRPMMAKTMANESQAVLLTEYLRHSQSLASAWINDCKNKEELIHKGQDKLWKTIDGFHDNMKTLSNNGFRFQAGDTEILEQALSIIGTVHLMHAAEKGDIIFNPVENPIDKDEEDGPPIQDSQA